MKKSELIQKLNEIDGDFEVVLCNKEKAIKSEGENGFNINFDIVVEELDDLPKRAEKYNKTIFIIY